jgi:hypothetical protein
MVGPAISLLWQLARRFAVLGSNAGAISAAAAPPSLQVLLQAA